MAANTERKNVDPAEIARFDAAACSEACAVGPAGR